jgi:hypothetical protein
MVVSSKRSMLINESPDMLQANARIDVDVEASARGELAEKIVLREEVTVEHAAWKEVVDAIVVERIVENMFAVDQLLEDEAIDAQKSCSDPLHSSIVRLLGRSACCIGLRHAHPLTAAVLALIQTARDRMRRFEQPLQVLTREPNVTIDEDERSAIGRKELGGKDVACSRDVRLAFQTAPRSVQAMRLQQANDEFAIGRTGVKRCRKQCFHVDSCQDVARFVARYFAAQRTRGRR